MSKPIGVVDEQGRFHCNCGATHSRGSINGKDVYRCLKCGKNFKIKGVVKLR